MTKLQNRIRIICIVFLFLTGINALIAGLLFIIDPSGNKMGMHIDYLAHAPFSNFLIPGIVLFLVNGVCSIFTAILSLIKHSYYPLFILVQGLLLPGWIIIQVIMVRDFNLLHAVMLSIGLLFFFCGIYLNRKMV